MNGHNNDSSLWQCRDNFDIPSIDGNYTRLERLSVNDHSERGLYDALMCSEAKTRFTYLLENAPANKDDYFDRMKLKEASKDPFFYSIIDKNTGKIGGYLSVMRIFPEHGVLEIGHVYMGPTITRSRISTEAVYLLINHAFNTLNYRRVEWKCDSLNQPSRNAALRFGFKFEGIFRKHLIIKGKNRDTAWFAMTDDDWKEEIESSFNSWLDFTNFTPEGNQVNTLASFRME